MIFFEKIIEQLRLVEVAGPVPTQSRDDLKAVKVGPGHSGTSLGQDLARHVQALRERKMPMGKAGHGSGPPRLGTHRFLLESSEKSQETMG